MITVRYTALRQLQAATVLGERLTRVFDPSQASPTRQTVGTESISLSGRTQHIVQRRDTRWRFAFVQVEEGSAAFTTLFEFLSSVDHGEHFDVDLSGIFAPETGFQRAVLVGNFQQERIPLLNEWRFSFTIRILP